MDRNGADAGRDAIATIGAGVTITGEVACVGDLQLDGTVNGDVRCATLFLGEMARVEGSVQADRVRVSGSVDGTIMAGDLAVEPTAVIKGELHYTRLKVTAGAAIQGTLKHRPAEQSDAPEASLKLVEAAAGPAPQPASPAAPQPWRVYGD